MFFTNCMEINYQAYRILCYPCIGTFYNHLELQIHGHPKKKKKIKYNYI